MDQRAIQHPRHDLHVAVPMGLESGSGRDRVVVVDGEHTMVRVSIQRVNSRVERMASVQPPDALLFATPLYNFGVSQHFKTWVDMVIADPRMAAGTQPILAEKPAVLVTVRGGNYRPGTPREGWDHATGWMRRILADVWHLDLKVVQAEFTLVGVNPALDQFTDLARQLRQEAEAQARRHGRELAATVTSAIAA